MLFVPWRQEWQLTIKGRTTPKSGAPAFGVRQKMITPLRPTFEKRIKDAFSELREKQIEPWATFSARESFEITNYTGKKISYSGIEFEGSPRDVFWSRYIEPFIEDIAINEIKAASEMAGERKVNSALILDEVEDLLLQHSRAILERMADIDRRQRSKGYPEHTVSRSIESEFHSLRNFIELHIRAEKELAERSKLELWYKNNKFYIWAAGLLVALIAAYSQFA